jgi:hypothetical protein
MAGHASNGTLSCGRGRARAYPRAARGRPPERVNLLGTPEREPPSGKDPAGLNCKLVFLFRFAFRDEANEFGLFRIGPDNR